MITAKKILFLSGLIFHVCSHAMSVSSLVHDEHKNPKKEDCLFFYKEKTARLKQKGAASDPNIKYLCPLCKIGQESRLGICGSVLALRNHFVFFHKISRYTCKCGEGFGSSVDFQVHVKKNGRKRHEEEHAPTPVFCLQYGSRQRKRKGNEQFRLLSENGKCLKQAYRCRRKVQRIDCVE